MNYNHLILCSIVVVFLCDPVYSKPEFEITASTSAAEKGHNFQIHVKMKSTEALHEIVVSITEPDGFAVEAIESPGIVIQKEEETNSRGVAIVDNLGVDSSITVAFSVTPPGLWGQTKSGVKKRLYSTREPKLFPVNVFYKVKKDSGMMEGMYTETLSIRYTTSLGLYIAAGLFGVLLGFIVKIATQYKQDIAESLNTMETTAEKVKTFFFELLVARLPLLLTLIIIGFGVLLSLARDGLPVSSWHQAIALGIGVGLLSDEQLITKIKKAAL